MSHPTPTRTAVTVTPPPNSSKDSSFITKAINQIAFTNHHTHHDLANVTGTSAGLACHTSESSSSSVSLLRHSPINSSRVSLTPSTHPLLPLTPDVAFGANVGSTQNLMVTPVELSEDRSHETGPFAAPHPLTPSASSISAVLTSSASLLPNLHTNTFSYSSDSTGLDTTPASSISSTSAASAIRSTPSQIGRNGRSFSLSLTNTTTTTTPTDPVISSSSSSSSSPPPHIRARIRSTVKAASRDRASRSQAEFQKEWSTIIAKWNEYQLSGLGGLVKPSKELVANQTKLFDLLTHQGIPSNLRSTVWLQMIGNGLHITQQRFEELKAASAHDRNKFEAWRKSMVDEAEAARNEPSNESLRSSSSESRGGAVTDPSFTSFMLIDQDLPRTFPELAFFHHGGPYEHSLRVVLECTARYRRERLLMDPESANSSSASSLPSTGYVQGMSFLASILFLALGDDEFIIFLTLANLLENPQEQLAEVFQMTEQTCARYMQQFRQQFVISLPTLAQHFDRIALEPDMFLWKWLFSVYSQVLDLDVVFRIWDCFLWECFHRRGQLRSFSSSAFSSPSFLSSSSSTRDRAADAIRLAFRDARGVLEKVTKGNMTTNLGSNSSSQSPSPPTPNSSPAEGSGFAYLFRVALGLLSMYSDALLQCSFEECLYFLQHLPAGKSTNGNSGASVSTSGFVDSDEPFEIDTLMAHVKDIKMDSKIWTRASLLAPTNTTVPTLLPPRSAHRTSVSLDSSASLPYSHSYARPDYSGYGSPDVIGAPQWHG